ncbi:hypothetical protein NGRA_2026, partial [Nosema granulosis]
IDNLTTLVDPCLSSENIVFEPSISPIYLARMDRHSLVHLSKYEFEVGDKVLVASDFDNNTKTKKLKLSSFYSNINEITEMLSNNQAKVKDPEGNLEVVHLSRLKKIKKS